MLFTRFPRLPDALTHLVDASSGNEVPPLPTGFVIGFGVLFAAAVVFLVWQFARTFSSRRRDSDMARMAQRHNLVIEDDVVDALDRYVTVRSRWATACGGVAFVVFVGVFLTGQLWGTTSVGAATGIVSFAAVATGGLVGTLIGGAVGRRSAAGTTTTARLQPLTLRELLDPAERLLARWSAVISVPLTVVLLLLSTAPWTDARRTALFDLRWLVVLALVGAGVIAAAPLIAARVQRLRALGGGENALAWSDALTARTVRDALAIGVVLAGGSALLAFMSLGFALPADWNTAALVVTNISAPVALIIFLGAFAVVQSRSPERHVQRTLWPQFALDPTLDRPSRLGVEPDAPTKADQRPDAQ